MASSWSVKWTEKEEIVWLHNRQFNVRLYVAVLLGLAVNTVHEIEDILCKGMVVRSVHMLEEQNDLTLVYLSDVSSTPASLLPACCRICLYADSTSRSRDELAKERLG